MKNAGSASIELLAAAPFFAMLIIFAVQIDNVFLSVSANLDRAAGDADIAVLNWERSHSDRGFLRPCLEMISEDPFSYGDKIVKLGFGDLSYEFIPKQEVILTDEKICIHKAPD